MASVRRRVRTLASLPASVAPSRASSGGPPIRKNSVSGMIVSQPSRDLVREMAVLSPATGVTMAGLPDTAEPPWVSWPARSATASTRSNISRRGRKRGSIWRMVCGARASQSVAGPHAAFTAAATDAHTTSMTSAAARPRRRPQLCSRSTAGVSSSVKNTAIATGISTSCAKYTTTPAPMMATSQTALTSLGSGRSSVLAGIGAQCRRYTDAAAGARAVAVRRFGSAAKSGKSYRGIHGSHGYNRASLAEAFAEAVMEQKSPRRIVVADDNEDSAESFAMLLSFSGHEVRVAHDGAAALDAVRDFRPDFAFLDIGMPGLTGYEVAQAVRAEPWGREVKLIAVTGWGQPDDRLRARTAGFDRHLIKPIDPAEVDRLLDA